MDEDECYALRTAFYIGDYNKVQKEYKNLNFLSGNIAKERDSFQIRSLVAQNRFKEASRLAKGESTPIIAAKQLITYKQTKADNAKEIVIDQCRELVKEKSYLDNTAFCVIVSQIFIEHALYREALELVVDSRSNEGNLEKLLCEMQIYLKIFRPELAQKSLQKMQDMEDDDALTQIAQISLKLFHGGAEKVNEANDLIEDLINANDATIQLLNMQCVANMHLKNWNEAWKLCKRSRDLAKQYQSENKHFEIATATLINSITCLRHLNKQYTSKGNEILEKLKSELKRIAPDHKYLKEQEEMEAMFDKCAKNFKL